MPRLVHVQNAEHLKLFNTIAIETAAQCNRACVFCPNHHTDRPDDYMPMEMIERIVDELRALRFAGRVTNYIYNEPMRDSRCLEIIRLIRRNLPRACIMVSTNGDYLKSADNIEALYEAGVTQLLINVYSASDGDPNPGRVAHGAALAAARYQMLLGWVTTLGLDQESSPYLYARPVARIARVEPKFGVRKEDKNLAKYELQNRSGNIDWFQPGLQEPLARMCVRPFRMLNINWRGEAILCCNDYHGVTNMGNVADHSLVDLWNCDSMNQYRLYLQNKQRNFTLCDKCDYRGGSYTHMVDTVTFGAEKDRALLDAIRP